MRESLVCCAMAGLLIWSSTHAEVIMDGSLGPEGPLTADGREYRIGAELGEQHGSNLFHSFQLFNLTAEEIATFSGPRDIQHVIGRVTGGEPSLIEGSLRSTMPGSQLWLFNPAGMSFSGVYEVPGGVAAATALALSLKDGGMFRADNPAQSVLTIAPPQVFFQVDPEPVPIPEEFRESALHGQAETNDGIHFSFAPPQESLATWEETPPECGTRREISRFTIRNYLGNPSLPDDWQGSDFLLMDDEENEETVPG